MFTSHYQLRKEPDRAGVSVVYFEPSTHVVADIIYTPVTLSSELVEVFNRAPQDDFSAYEWGHHPEARNAAHRLRMWLQSASTSTPDLRFTPVIYELARRVQESYAASRRLFG
jgi:hypothetical protein